MKEEHIDGLCPVSPPTSANALAALWVFQFPDLIQRIGCILTALGAGFIIYQIRLKQLQKGLAEIKAARMGHVASVVRGPDW